MYGREPGYIQWLLGPSLPLARYVMLGIGVLNLLGLWMLAQRIAGVKAATITVWLFALDQWLIKTWTLAISQGWTALVFLGSLLFLLRKEKNTCKNILFGSLMAALALFIRQNMVLILPIVLGYIFWEHGKRCGLWAMLTMLLVIGTGHALWWPHILSIWAPWLPAQWTPFLNPWRVQWAAQVQPRSYAYTWGQYWPLLFAALRSYSPDFIGASLFTTLVAWRHAWRAWRGRVGIFLAILWLWLVTTHALATIGGYCPHCLQFHLGFFAGPGWLALIAAWPFLRKPQQRQPFVGLIWGALLFGSIWSWAQEFINQHPGFLIRIWTVWRSEWFGTLFARLGLERPKPPDTVDLLPWLSLLLVLLVAGSSRQIFKRFKVSWAVLFWLLLVFMPSPLLTGRPLEYQCAPRHGDLLQKYHRYGTTLSDLLPVGTLYWEATRYNALLLYLSPEVHVPPPMLNGAFNYYADGHPAALARLGFWNAQLKHQWFTQADMWAMLQRPGESPPAFPPEPGRLLALSLPNCEDGQEDILWIFVREAGTTSQASDPSNALRRK